MHFLLYQVWRNPSNHSHGTVPCNRGHQFLHPSPDQASIVAEWELVCDRAHLLPVLSLAYLAGLLVGGLILGWLADSLGRRPVMLACLYSQCLLAIATHWVTRIEVFLAIRAAQGLLVTGLQVNSKAISIGRRQ